MRAGVIGVALAAAAAVAIGYTATRAWVCHAPVSDLARLQDVSHLARALDLRPDQITTISAMQKRLCSNLAACSARHCACRREMASVIFAEPFDPARVREIRESLCRAYADSEMAALEHIRNIRDVLDARQRISFDRMITEALARPCGICSTGECECETRSTADKH